MMPNKWFINIIVLMIFIISSLINAEERSKVSITIYKNNLAVIKEIRKFDLKKGICEFNISDIPDNIDPTSILVRPVENIRDIQLLEKEYNYNVINSKDILENNIGKDAEISVQGDKVLKGKLMKSTEREFIIKDNLENLIIIDKNKVVNIAFPSENENLLTKPVLKFVVNSAVAKKIEFSISYFTESIGWKAAYLAFLQDDEKVMEIFPFAVINNETGINYNNSEIKLISGEIKRAGREPIIGPRAMGMGLRKEAIATVPRFEEKEIFEYYSYTLDKKTDLLRKCIKDILLMPAKKVNVSKKYIYDGARNGEKVLVNFNFKNTKPGGFGSPLPSGDIGIFKTENDNFLVLLGQYHINAAPVGKEVNLQAGVAFDIKGQRIQKEITKISRTEREEVFQITIKNSKNTKENVTVVEHPYGEWKIIESSHEYFKKDVQNLEFKLQVNPSSEETLIYKIRYK